MVSMHSPKNSQQSTRTARSAPPSRRIRAASSSLNSGRSTSWLTVARPFLNGPSLNAICSGLSIRSPFLLPCYALAASDTMSFVVRAFLTYWRDRNRIRKKGQVSLPFPNSKYKTMDKPKKHRIKTRCPVYPSIPSDGIDPPYPSPSPRGDHLLQLLLHLLHDLFCVNGFLRARVHVADDGRAVQHFLLTDDDGPLGAALVRNFHL